MASDQQNITRRAIIGLAQFIVVLGLMFFLPAWTVDYWQAWLYLFVFTTMTTFTTVYFLRRDPKLVERRLQPGPIAEKQSRQKTIQWFTSACLILLFVVSSLDHRFGWSHVGARVAILANVFLVAGFAVMFLVLRENSYASSIVEVGEGQSVVSTGPYRFVRHPMYAGGLLMIFCTPIALGSLWGLLPAIGMFVAIVVRLLDEERFLSQHLRGYDDYRTQTRARLFPFIW